MFALELVQGRDPERPGLIMDADEVSLFRWKIIVRFGRYFTFKMQSTNSRNSSPLTAQVTLPAKHTMIRSGRNPPLELAAFPLSLEPSTVPTRRTLSPSPFSHRSSYPMYIPPLGNWAMWQHQQESKFFPGKVVGIDEANHLAIIRPAPSIDPDMKEVVSQIFAKSFKDCQERLEDFQVI